MAMMTILLRRMMPAGLERREVLEREIMGLLDRRGTLDNSNSKDGDLDLGRRDWRALDWGMLWGATTTLVGRITAVLGARVGSGVGDLRRDLVVLRVASGQVHLVSRRARDTSLLGLVGLPEDEASVRSLNFFQTGLFKIYIL